MVVSLSGLRVEKKTGFRDNRKPVGGSDSSGGGLDYPLPFALRGIERCVTFLVLTLQHDKDVGRVGLGESCRIDGPPQLPTIVIQNQNPHTGRPKLDRVAIREHDGKLQGVVSAFLGSTLIRIL